MVASRDEIAVTKDLNENVLIELDKDGNVVSMTIEHVRKQTEPRSLSNSRSLTTLFDWSYIGLRYNLKL
jgi:uncharacterized protein YuzE